MNESQIAGAACATGSAPVGVQSMASYSCNSADQLQVSLVGPDGAPQGPILLGNSPACRSEAEILNAVHGTITGLTIVAACNSADQLAQASLLPDGRMTVLPLGGPTDNCASVAEAIDRRQTVAGSNYSIASYQCNSADQLQVMLVGPDGQAGNPTLLGNSSSCRAHARTLSATHAIISRPTLVATCNSADQLAQASLASNGQIRVLPLQGPSSDCNRIADEVNRRP